MLLAVNAFGQTATQKVVNTAVIYTSTSPVTFQGSTTVQGTPVVGTNLTVASYMEVGTNATTALVGLSVIQNNTPGNPTLFILNRATNGSAGILYRNYQSTDAGNIGFDNTTTSMVYQSFLTASAYQKFTLFAGNTGNEIYLMPSVTTNTFDFVVGRRMTALTNNATFYQMAGNPGGTASVTNLGPSLGSSNVVVFTNGLFMNTFTIP